jgi:hypothetical protein
MKTFSRSMVVAGTFAAACLVTGGSQARAQAFGFGYVSPGLGFGVGAPLPGYYSGYGGFAYPYGAAVAAPMVAAPMAAPMVVAPAPLIVRPPLVVPGPYFYGAGYRPFGPFGYRRFYRW